MTEVLTEKQRVRWRRWRERMAGVTDDYAKAKVLNCDGYTHWALRRAVPAGQTGRAAQSPFVGYG